MLTELESRRTPVSPPTEMMIYAIYESVCTTVIPGTYTVTTICFPRKRGIRHREVCVCVCFSFLDLSSSIQLKVFNFDSFFCAVWAVGSVWLNRSQTLFYFNTQPLWQGGETTATLVACSRRLSREGVFYFCLCVEIIHWIFFFFFDWLLLTNFCFVLCHPPIVVFSVFSQ